MVRKRKDRTEQAEETKEVYIAHANLLKGRGWTEKLIKIFLIEPCKVVPNPHYRSASPMRLYKLTRVEHCENLEDFQKYIERKQVSRQKASDSAKERAKIARNSLIDKISQINIEIPIFDKKTLIENACSHYNNLWAQRENEKKHANPSADEEFINRITVNYLRHNETQYEQELYNIFGKVGVRDAYVILKNMILHKISTTYPFLGVECERQKIQERDI